MHSGQARKRRYIHVFLMIALTSASWSGCARPRPYQPDTTLVSKLGHDDALTRLRTLLRRTESSPALDVHVTDEHIELIWLDTRTTTTWRFSHIESIDIRGSDHVVTVRVRHGLQPYHIDFTTADDATTFVDLLMSFYQAGSSAEVALPSLTRERERP